MNNTLIIMKNKARLEKMIREGAPYEKILKQSQRLDKYIMEDIRNKELYDRKIK